MFYKEQDDKPFIHRNNPLRVVHKQVNKPVRTLTVSYAHYATQAAHVALPYIRLKGKWLERLGFVQGQKIAIEIAEKKLVITVVEDAG
jgi:hypothetical protein